MQPAYRALGNDCATAQVALGTCRSQSARVPRVLVLDDDQSIAELMRVVLEDAGYAVTVSVDPAVIPNGRFDCVVTDLMSLTAYAAGAAREWVLRLRDRFPGVPVVVVTAHAAARDDRPVLGAREVIIKPFDVDQIADAVRRTITS
jgi:CheY-like chemotaxis protein